MSSIATPLLRRQNSAPAACAISMRWSRSKTPSSPPTSCRGGVFATFITAPKSSLIVAEDGGKLAGYALVLYPARSQHARLYSIAVAPHVASRGIGPLLLAAAEAAAARRRRRAMRLEVHEHNTRAIGRYEKSGYRLFGRHHRYYDDGGDALRFEKPLGWRRGAQVPTHGLNPAQPNRF